MLTSKNKHYRSATVVFDGYVAGPSIKDNNGSKPPFIRLRTLQETPDLKGKNEFLSRVSNKQHLINLISDKRQSVGCMVIQAAGNAYVDIAKTAVNTACVHSTTLVGEDTGLLILLLRYYMADGQPVYCRSDKQSRGIPEVYNINAMKCCLGSEMCSQTLFLHAFTGCDSTSRVYGIGR